MRCLKSNFAHNSSDFQRNYGILPYDHVNFSAFVGLWHRGGSKGDRSTSPTWVLTLSSTDLYFKCCLAKSVLPFWKSKVQKATPISKISLAGDHYSRKSSLQMSLLCVSLWQQTFFVIVSWATFVFPLSFTCSFSQFVKLFFFLNYNINVSLLLNTLKWQVTK